MLVNASPDEQRLSGMVFATLFFGNDRDVKEAGLCRTSINFLSDCSNCPLTTAYDQMSNVINKAKKRIGSKRVAGPTDEELLLGYRSTGRRELFEEIIRRYDRELFSYLRRYLGDAEMAADVFQTTFLQLHLKCDKFQSGRRLRPWLYTIATNQAIDAQRREKRHRMVSLDAVSSNSHDDDVVRLLDLMASQCLGPDEQLGLAEDREWIRQSLADLPDHLRCVVTLVYYQGLKYREAAEVLDIPVGTVKSRMHTALLKLNEVFQNAEVRK